MKNVEFKYDSDAGIMYKMHSGIVTAYDVITSWEWAFENSIIPENTKLFLLDYRDAVLDNPTKISKAIVSFYHANLHRFRHCKFAIVSFSSQNVATSMLIKKGDKDYVSEPFSHIEKAIEWLLQK
ncbi:MAG: hypothetical protein JXR36_00850 [Bacteroidales bacterium]|nr:hypothetical protein [Bacteroidales bacterium]